ANGTQYESLPQNHPEHVMSLRTERHADADLAGALGNEIGDDAVDAERGQHQTEDCKRGEEKPGKGEVFEQAIGERACYFEFVHGQVWIKIRDSAAQRGDRALRRAERAQLNSDPGPRLLSNRAIDLPERVRPAQV